MLQKIEVFKFIKDLSGKRAPGSNIHDLMKDDDDQPGMQAQISENLLELGPHIIYLGGVLPVEDLA